MNNCDCSYVWVKIVIKGINTLTGVFSGVTLYNIELSGRLHDPVAIHLGKNPRFPFDSRLNGPQSRPGHWEIEKYLLPLTGVELEIQPTASLLNQIRVYG
jgi:hypothetical protein